MTSGKHFAPKPSKASNARRNPPPPAATPPVSPCPETEALPAAQKPRAKKKLPLPVKLLIGLLTITFLLCGTVIALWLHGRHLMTQNNLTPVFPPQLQEENTTGEAPVTTQTTGTEEEDGVVIRYQDKYYRYNDEITNILLIGVDGDSPKKDQDPHQSDLLVLAALDRANNKITLLNIPRDTMCDMEVPDEDGNVTGTVNLQIALSYAYGSTIGESAELCKNAVSSVLCGLPIHGYGAFYLDGIPALNDALGGVTVTILDDYAFADMPAGKEMTLNGEQAARYMRSRLSDRVDGSLLRLARQKQYMLAMINQAKTMLKGQPGQIVPLYRTLEEYILTDLSIGSISYLASIALPMDFSGEVITLDGEMIMSEDGVYAEYHLNQNALYETILSVFYTKIER